MTTGTLREFPIGIQSFEKLRERDLLYVDKTQYIIPLLRGGGIYFLSRPRRFGKSLFLSTLQAYFEGNKALFEGLALEQAEQALAALEKREVWQKYPILYLDLNNESYRTAEDLVKILNRHLRDWEGLYGKGNEDDSLSGRFEGIIKRAYQETGQQVVFLVDEYDKPLLESVVNKELYETYRSMLYGLYSNIKNCDRYLRFVFLTGVSRFGKLTIFSGLNNLNDISMDTAYAGICGITEEELVAYFAPEIKALAEALQLTHEATIATLKKRYDGYLFSEDGEHVYNPFSLLNVLQKKKLKDYWYATGTPTFLVKYLQTLNYFLPDLEHDVEMGMSGLQVSPIEAKSPIPILFQAGYLTIREYRPDEGIYRLGFPNEEVRFGFLKNLLQNYAPEIEDASSETAEFLREIRAGQVDGFMKRLEGLIAGIPYDSFAPTIVKYRERDAQVAVYLIFSLMGQFIASEVHSVIGRADAVVHTTETIYIFEFKLEGSSTPAEALAQIEEKGYATPYQKQGKKVIAIGVSFDAAKRNIGGWVTKTLVEA